MSTLAVAGLGNSSILNAFAKSLLLLWAPPAWGSGTDERGKMAMESSVPAKN
jgi:hypothetical protein